MAAMGIPVTIRLIDKPDWPWIKAQASPVLCEDTTGIIAVRNGIRVAAAVFDSWSPNSCLAHLIIQDPFVLRHGFLHQAFRLVFITRDRGLMTGLTPANNRKALALNKHIGFREVYRIPDGHKPGIDSVLQIMIRDECRWLDLPKERAA